MFYLFRFHQRGIMYGKITNILPFTQTIDLKSAFYCTKSTNCAEPYPLPFSPLIVMTGLPTSGLLITSGLQKTSHFSISSRCRLRISSLTLNGRRKGKRAKATVRQNSAI